MPESPSAEPQMIEEPHMIEDPQMIESPSDEPQMMDVGDVRQRVRLAEN